MKCSKRFCKLMIDINLADQNIFKSTKMNLLSTEGKIITTLINNPECSSKDLPILAGVSTRTAYDCVNKLTAIGVVEKQKNLRDGRSKYVRLLTDQMCEKICRNIG